MFGDHAAYIIPSYAISATVFIALIIWLRLQYSSRRKALELLERAGVKRRSDRNKSVK